MGAGTSKSTTSHHFCEKDLFKEALGINYKIAKGLKIENKPNPFKKVGQNNLFKEEVIDHADESGPVQPWLVNVVAPSVPITDDKNYPKVSLSIEHAFGFRCQDVRNSLFFLTDDEILYVTGALGIIQNIKTRDERIFGGLEYGEYSECHSDDVLCVDIFKGDVSMIATGQRDLKPTVHIWSPIDVSVCYCSFQLPNSAREVCCLDFDYKGQFLIAIGKDPENSFYIYNIRTKTIDWTSPTGPNIIFDVEWNDTSDQFCLVGDKTIIFGYAEFKKIQKIKFKKNVENTDYYTCVGLSSRRKWIIGDSKSNLSLWKLRQPEVESVINFGKGTIQALKVSNTLDYVYCSDSSHNFYVVEEQSSSLRILKKFTMNDTIKSIDVNSKGNLILGTISGDIIYKEIMETKNKKATDFVEYCVAQSHYDGEITGLDVVSNKYVITAGNDNRVILWNIDDKRCEQIGFINEVEIGQIKPITNKEIPPNFTLNQQAQALAYNAFHDHVAISIKNGTLSIRKSYLKLSQRLNNKDIAMPFNSVPVCLKYSSDNMLLAAGSTDNSIHLFNAKDNYVIFRSISGFLSPAIEIDWDSTSTYIQAVCINNDFQYINIKAQSPIISAPEEIRDVNWSTLTCKFGYYVQGIFLGSTDPNYINTVACNKSKSYLISGDDDKLLNLYNYPVISESAKCKSY